VLHFHDRQGAFALLPYGPRSQIFDVKIPLVDLQAQHRQVTERVRAGWDRVLESSDFILGEEVAAFEAEFAAFSEVRYAVGVANGTDALELGVRSLGIGPGDEVILPANTFVATASAMVRAGARPVLVDVERSTHLLDVAAVEAAITPRTRAVVPVHLYGQMAPMGPLLAIAEALGIAIVEDACQSHGARQGGRRSGGFGAVAGTSFYPGKNLGAYGDGGAVLTNDEELARCVRALRNHGSDLKHRHPQTGFNSRLDTLQAVVLRAKLEHLASWNDQRRAAALRYDELLEELDEVELPVTLDGNEHVWHLYVVRVPRRDEVLRDLRAAGIGADVHYPVPVHLHGAFTYLGYCPGAFPIAEAAARAVLSLPIFPGITPAQQEQVRDELEKALR
jgi:dTDP-4-amino-4,6-dideoxygalactose transaminase